MADTRQVVSWSLERPCPFRTGEQWFLPGPTYSQLADLRTLASAESDRRNVAGICVTSWTTEQDNSGKAHDIPCSGFRIEERLGAIGGVSGVQATCAACEANVKTELGIQVAGCFGYLDIWPDSKELDEQLWKIIEDRGMEPRLRATFPVTTPLWYGFWIDSPLRRPQAEFLYELLDAACDYDDPRDKDVRHFLHALTAAMRWELPVHVSLAPLGHTDCGWYTIFPHCPRCKANAPVGRWQESYSTAEFECEVCSHKFIPNDHQSSERDDYDWDSQSLEKQLGEADYEQFVRTFLLHRDCSLGQVDEIFDNKNNGPVLRKIQAVLRERNATLHRLRQESLPEPAHSHPASMSLALTDDVDLELVLVPAGEFLMGSPDADANPDELPQHLVRFAQPFYIGRFPVTQEQWKSVMGKSNSRHRGEPGLPVDQVSWFDCQDFCEQLCKRLKRVIRLPSEAEWEYACRAGTTTAYAFGDVLLPVHANFTPLAQQSGMPPASEEETVRTLEQLADDEPRQFKNARPTPVGIYPPNAWGLYDMHGNVEEWCEDVWHQNYESAPSDGSSWMEGADQQPFMVLRGGWCAAAEAVCTSSSRRQMRADAGSSDEDPDEAEEDDGFMDAIRDLLYIPHGFRIVCEVPVDRCLE